jgi:hypothetical protein
MLNWVFGLILLLRPGVYEGRPSGPLSADDLGEIREQARQSHLIVEATALEPALLMIERPELRRRTMRRGPNGEMLEVVKVPGDHVVGALTRFRVDQVLKPHRRVSVDDVIEVVAFARHPWPWVKPGSRYVLFLDQPFRIEGADPDMGWHTLYGATVRDPVTGRDAPFVPHDAYGDAPAGSMFSPAAAASREIVPENLPVIDALREQIALTLDAVVPTVTLDQPAEGAPPLRAVASLAARAADNVGIEHVEWRLEPEWAASSPTPVAATTTIGTTHTPPYSQAWDTTQFPDGRYVLWTIAVDFAGNAGIARRDVTIDNTHPASR